MRVRKSRSWYCAGCWAASDATRMANIRAIRTWRMRLSDSRTGQRLEARAWRLEAGGWAAIRVVPPLDAARRPRPRLHGLRASAAARRSRVASRGARAGLADRPERKRQVDAPANRRRRGGA